MQTQIDQALFEAVSAIYFDDNSDFKPALLRIIRILGGNEALEKIENEPRRLYMEMSGENDGQLR